MAEEQTRVLHVLSQFERSGAEMMLLQSADDWRRHGYELDLLATGPQQGAMAESLPAAGLGTHHIAFRSGMRYLPSMDFAPRFLELCRRRNYDVLHLHTEAAMLLFTMLGRLAGVPTIVRTVHSAFTFDGALRLRKRMERRLARAAGVRFACVSESVQQVEADYYGDAGLYTANWFDVDHFRPPTIEERREARKMLACPSDTFVLVSVGNCGSIKNHEALLRALSIASLRRKFLYLHVGREHPDQPERRLVGQLGLGLSVRFLGSQPDPRPYLWAADLFVMPSLREGLGNAALEAVGAGTPALLADVAGLRDITRKTRWITAALPEPQALAAALITCSEVPPTRAREQALQDSATIHREYSIRSGVEHLIRSLYQDPRLSATNARTDARWQAL